MFANLTFRSWLIESEAIYSKRLAQAIAQGKRNTQHLRFRSFLTFND